MSIESRMSAAETMLTALNRTVYGNGQPGLEAKLMSEIGKTEGKLTGHIDRVDRHTNGNLEDGDGLIMNELRVEREAREKQHEENNIAREKDKKEQVEARENDRKEAKEERAAMGKKIDRLTLVQAGISGAFVFYKIAMDFGWLHVVPGAH